jgi:hypothetical protein
VLVYIFYAPLGHRFSGLDFLPVMGYEETAAVDIIATLCFLSASTISFIAGALYGHEAEYEKTQREKGVTKDLEQQPLLPSQDYLSTSIMQ